MRIQYREERRCGFRREELLRSLTYSGRRLVVTRAVIPECWHNVTRLAAERDALANEVAE